MIAGRLQWRDAWPEKPGRRTAALFEFEGGVLELTEAGSKKRASIHLVHGAAEFRKHDRGGLELETATAADFARALTARNHTLKRALTDPTILSGIGNAYSDEILHRARLSPTALTQRLDPAEIGALFAATRSVLAEWTGRLRADCGTRVQRIRYASNETNYCPRCQTGGRLLADRSLSRLLKRDWPRTIEELEERSKVQ